MYRIGNFELHNTGTHFKVTSLITGRSYDERDVDKVLKLLGYARGRYPFDGGGCWPEFLNEKRERAQIEIIENYLTPKLVKDKEFKRNGITISKETVNKIILINSP